MGMAVVGADDDGLLVGRVVGSVVGTSDGQGE